MIKYTIKFDTKLTKTAIEIFGESVNNAYICSTDRLHPEDQINDNYVQTEGGEIKLNGDLIWLEFKDGRLVEFLASELAYFTKINEDKLEIIKL